MTEQRVIDVARLAARGDPEALEKLLEMKYRCILMHAIHILGSEQDAEDIAQEACMAIAQNITKLKAPEAVDGWIYQIVKNCCRVHWKRAARVTAYEEPQDMLQLSKLAAEDKLTGLNSQSRGADPEQALIRRELAEKLLAGIRRLRKERREFIYLYHYGDFSYDEIAAMTHTSAKTVSSNITRARKQLSALFSDEEIAELGFAVRKTKPNLVPGAMITAAYRGQESLLPAKDAGFSVFQNIPSGGAREAVGALTKTGAIPKTVVGLYSGLSAAAVLIFVLGFTPSPAPLHTKTAVRLPAVQTPVVQAPARKADLVPDNGRIVFSGGLVPDSPLNPAAVTFQDSNIDATHASWQIVGANVRESGEGLDPAAALGSLKAKGETGTYNLILTIVDQQGNTVTKTRSFEIG